ncbi:MAG: glucose 1-dehydrogenase [Pseudomonadota bacterium]
MDRVKDKVVLVTGAAAGIGKATAALLHREGATVIVSDLNGEAASALASELGDNCTAFAHDVCEDSAWHHVVDATVAEHGRLDVLVNNAGILATAGSQTVEDTSLEQWRTVQQVNVEGVMLGCQHAVRVMRERGGSIVNLSSVAAILATPHIFAYGASKGAVRQLTKSVAAHCGRMGYGIRCNSVHPGVIETQMGDAVFALGGGDAEQLKATRTAMVPLGRFGVPDDVANCVLFLASDDAAYVTAAELVVDGGYTAV